MREIEVLKAARYQHSPPWWEWEISIYLFLGGIAAGLLLLSAARALLDPDGDRSASFRSAGAIALALLSLGMLALWLDLEKRWQVYRFYLAFRPAAPMSWGAWILLAVIPLGALLALGETAGRPRRLSRWAREPRRRRRIAWAAAAAGLALGIYTGVLLSAMAARPLWNSAVLGPLFLVSGLSTGAALLMLLPVAREERRRLARLDVGLLLAEATLLGLFVLTLATGAAAQREAGRLLLWGAYGPAFWSLVVAAGLLVPLAAGISETRGSPGSRWFVPALVLAGGLALRWILVSAGQSTGIAAV